MIGILQIEYIFLFEPVQKNLTILGLFFDCIFTLLLNSQFGKNLTKSLEFTVVVRVYLEIGSIQHV